MIHFTKGEATPFQVLAVGHKSGVFVGPSACTLWTYLGGNAHHSQVSHPPHRAAFARKK